MRLIYECSNSFEVVLLNFLSETAPAVQGVVRIHHLILSHSGHRTYIRLNSLPLEVRDCNCRQVDCEVFLDNIKVDQVLF